MTSTPNDGEKASELSQRHLEELLEGAIASEAPKRIFENWILAYKEWAEPSTDAPLSFIAWGALYSLASVIKRRVRIPKEIIGSWEVYPHLFLMFVGPAGLRKTSSIENFSLPLITPIPGVQIGATYFTKETFLTDLTTFADSSCSLVVGEFGELVQKNKPQELYDFLITLFDGGSKDQLSVSTFKRGAEIAIKPCVNMIAATTRSWITENMTPNTIGGGFSSRVIYVNETELRDNGLLIYRKRLRAIGLDRKEHEKALYADLLHISSIQGDFEISDETEDYINEWYYKHRDIARKATERMHGYYSRKPLMILKLAMLHSLATKDELILTNRDFDFGVWMMESTEPSLKATFAGVGKNEYTLTYDEIKDYIINNGTVTLSQILKEFLNVGEQSVIEGLIKTLIVMEYIKHENINGVDHFSAIGV